ncbi:MAG: SEL1-like repeat protein [Akkermansia sp.]|jgi:TPR repeat protein|nr:SEL1-like repeat protein [Akkermansia sp.]
MTFTVTLPEFNSFLEELGSEIEALLVKGDAYRWGNEEVEPDLNLAIEYYREAAEMGDAEAMRLLATTLEEVGQCDEARAWEERLAGMEH